MITDFDVTHDAICWLITYNTDTWEIMKVSVYSEPTYYATTPDLFDHLDQTTITELEKLAQETWEHLNED